MIDYLKQIQNRDQISYLLSTMVSPIICEVGVHQGANFRQLLTPNVSKAFGVDIWRNTENLGENDNQNDQEELDRMYNFLTEFYKNDNRVEFIREFSVIAAEKFQDNYFDFVYIDADHTYEAVIKDLRAWYPKVKIGGIIGGHDYIDGDLTLKLGHIVRFGIVEAVADFKKEFSIKEENCHITSETYGSYYIIKE